MYAALILRLVALACAEHKMIAANLYVEVFRFKARSIGAHDNRVIPLLHIDAGRPSTLFAPKARPALKEIIERPIKLAAQSTKRTKLQCCLAWTHRRQRTAAPVTLLVAVRAIVFVFAFNHDPPPCSSKR